MAIQGTNGTGNQFSDRFASGDVISASQLNDLINGISTALPQPYLGEGASISYGSGGTILTTIPDVQDEVGPEQFQVAVYGNSLKVARGRVITQDVWEGTYKDATTVEFTLNGIWAYPTGSKTSGSDTNGPWADSGSTYAIANATSGGSDYWGVYIVRQPLNKVGQKHTAEMVIMFTDSDAYDKTTPWGGAETTDSIRLYTVCNATSVEVDGVPAGDFVTSFDANPSQYNYNCQRVKVASITWSGGQWVLTQHLIGTLTLPNVIQHYGTAVGVDGARPDTYWPNYGSECDAWNGSWTGYTKATSPTAYVIEPPGFPA